MQSDIMMEISKYLVGKTIKVYILKWNLVYLIGILLPSNPTTILFSQQKIEAICYR